MIDVIFLSWNRRAFTEYAFANLLANTDWSLVDRLLVYDDRSTDGAREYLDEARKECPVPSSLIYLGFGSPPRTMNHYFAGTPAEYVMKVDSDIALGPGYLSDAHTVMEANPDLELLGLASGWTGVNEGPLGWEPASHIGGIGLMRSSAFTSRPKIPAEGRHGFGVFQDRYDLVRGWLKPDPHALQLDLLPFEPWASLSREYIAKGWQRYWPPYQSPSLWEWAFPDWREAA
jgi:Glycosyl transferase family 2